MKRGFASLSSRVLAAVLCSFLFAASLSAAECENRTARVFVIDNELWRSGVIATSATGATVRFSDCNGSFSQFNRHLPANGAAATDELRGGLLCSDPAAIAVAELPVTDGCATLATEAVFTDAAGYSNIVTIPELTAPMTEGGSSYLYRGIRATHPRGTFVGLLVSPAGAYTRAEIDVIDGSGAVAATHRIDIDGGWAFVQLGAELDAGTLRIRNIGPGIGPSPATSIDAIVLTGYGDGGSPRVVPPELEAAP